MRAIGWRIICTDMGCMSGRTGGDTKGITRWIRSKGMGYIFGQMGRNMMGCGKMGSSMGKGSIYYQIIQ